MPSQPQCPRCGSTAVSAHFTPASDIAPQDHGYVCSACGLIEARYINEPEYSALRDRWHDPLPETTYEEMRDLVARQIQRQEERDREWTWPTEPRADSWDRPSNRERRAEKLAEHFEETNYSHTTFAPNGHLRFSHHKRLPQNTMLQARIVGRPDDDRARWELAAWMRGQEDPRAAQVSDFIEAQLRMAEAVREDPRNDIRDQLPGESFEPRQDANWWRYPNDRSSGIGGALSDNLAVLQQEGLIADLRWYRGFVEHVAVKAHRFLEIADELYSLAPIRHLTITYAKGLDHQDNRLFEALINSPHLDRIRSLRFPVRVLDNEYTELNRLTDTDLELLAASPHVRGLRYLDLEDESLLTIRAFDALAASKNLPELSAVQFDLYRYDYIGAFTFGNVGPRTRELVKQPLKLYAPQLEARHGRIAWLHPVENYGTETPDLEAVVEHPVAVR